MSDENTAVIEGEETPSTEEELEQAQAESPQPEGNDETSGSTENEAADEVEATEESDSEEQLGVDIVIEGEAPPQEEKDEFAGQPAPPWAKELRETNRALKRKVRQFEARERESTQQREDLTLGPRPKLEDFEFDPDRHNAAMDEWYGKKAKIERIKEDQKATEEQEQKQMQKVEESYLNQKEKLSTLVSDYEEAEFDVEKDLTVQQQGIILRGVEDPATIIYTLGKRPDLREKLAALKSDPIKFAVELGKLEGKTKVKPRKPTTTPQRTVAGTSPSGGGVDHELERLEATAAKTGDRTPVLNYKRKIKERKT